MLKYKKAIVAVSGVFAVLGTILADGSVGGSESIALVSAIFVAVGVYYAKNAEK